MMLAPDSTNLMAPTSARSLGIMSGHCSGATAAQPLGAIAMDLVGRELRWWIMGHLVQQPQRGEPVVSALTKKQRHALHNGHLDVVLAGPKWERVGGRGGRWRSVK